MILPHVLKNKVWESWEKYLIFDIMCKAIRFMLNINLHVVYIRRICVFSGMFGRIGSVLERNTCNASSVPCCYNTLVYMYYVYPILVLELYRVMLLMKFRMYGDLLAKSTKQKLEVQVIIIFCVLVIMLSLFRKMH